MTQRKKTKPLEDMDLPDLTEPQRKFVEGLLGGKSSSDAYRSAYNAENMGQNSVWVEASRLRNNPSIALWLSAARQAELGHTRITLDQHIARLDRLLEIAVKTGNVGAAVQAEQLIGKAIGHYTERYEINTQDPRDMLNQIAQLSPALAAQLAKDENIPWDHTEH
jgi:phage terminase small subunit